MTGIYVLPNPCAKNNGSVRHAQTAMQRDSFGVLFDVILNKVLHRILTLKAWIWKKKPQIDRWN